MGLCRFSNGRHCKGKSQYAKIVLNKIAKYINEIFFISCTGTSGSSGSAGTAIRLNSQDSTASVDDAGSPWNATRQTSISLREWDIPYEELKIADKIGSGRFSTGKL